MNFKFPEIGQEEYDIPAKLTLPEPEPLAGTKPVNPYTMEMIRELTPTQKRLIGAGRAADQAIKGVKRLFGSQVDGSDDEYYNLISDDPNVRWSELAGEVALGTAVPFLRGSTFLRTMGKNAAAQGLFNAATTNSENTTDRAQAGVVGAAGAGAAMAGMKAGSKVFHTLTPRLQNLLNRGQTDSQGMPLPKAKTKWQTVSDEQMQQLADKYDAPLTIGDMRPGSLIAKAENWGRSMGESPVLDDQTKALARILHPTNRIQEGVEATRQGLRAEANKIFAPIDARIGKSSILIDPTETRNAFIELHRRFPKLIDESGMDQDVVDRLMAFKSSDQPVSFQEFREIQQSIGEAVGRAKDLVTNKTLPDKALGVANDAYRRSFDDLNSWGQVGTSKSTAKKYKSIVEDYRKAMDYWRETVVPFDENTLVQRLRDPSVSPEETLKALDNPMTKTARALVESDLATHSPETKEMFDLVRMLNRASRQSYSADPVDQVHWLDALSSISHPQLALGRGGFQHGTANPFIKDLYMSKNDSLMPIHSGTLGGVQNMLGRSLLSLGRESGLIPIGGLGLAFTSEDEPGGFGHSMPISTTNQQGTRP